MSDSRLDLSASSTFDATGRAELRMGPRVYGHSWTVSRLVISTGSTLTTQCRIYLNAIADSRLLAGSYSGNRDYNETTLPLFNLDTLIAVWSGGTPGSYATLNIQGTLTAAGRL